jgi:predicted DNA-binding protein YlxM (UPF0122 family)
MKEAIKFKEVEELISQFKHKLKLMYGIKPIIIMPYDDVYRLSIPETGEIVNNHLIKYSLTIKKKPINLQDNSRRDDRVLHHQAFCKICKDMNYSLSEIARYLGKDHSTIIYSVRRATDLISIADNRFLTVYNSLKKEIFNQIENGRDIQHIIKEADNSEPVLHAVLPKA